MPRANSKSHAVRSRCLRLSCRAGLRKRDGFRDGSRHRARDVWARAPEADASGPGLPCACGRRCLRTWQWSLLVGLSSSAFGKLS